MKVLSRTLFATILFLTISNSYAGESSGTGMQPVASSSTACVALPVSNQDESSVTGVIPVTKGESSGTGMNPITKGESSGTGMVSGYVVLCKPSSSTTI